MRNILLAMLLCPVLAHANFDIKSFMHMPKQMDSNLIFDYSNASVDGDYIEGTTKTRDRELSADSVSFNYLFGLFDDLTLIFNFDKQTNILKDTYPNDSTGLVLTHENKGFTDLKLGVKARIKDGSSGTTIMDILFNFSPGIFTKEEGVPKSTSSAGTGDGKPGNVSNGGHVFEGGVQFGKPMKGDWEWQAKLFYTLRLKADEVDLTDATVDKINSYGSYLISIKAQKYMARNESSLWSELGFEQTSSYKSRDTSSGNLTQFATATEYYFKFGARTSLLWPSLFGGIYGGVTKIDDVEGKSSGVPVVIKSDLGKTVGVEFKITI